jgi:hypothetical protein
MLALPLIGPFQCARVLPHGPIPYKPCAVPPALDKHTFRRPGFMRVLNITQYVEFYRFLEDREYRLGTGIDSPEALTKDITAIGQPLSQVYRHILFWYRPEFEVPLGSQYSKLRSYDVQKEVESFAFAVPTVDVEAPMLIENKIRVEYNQVT